MKRKREIQRFVLCTIRDTLAGMGAIMVGMMLMGALMRALGIG